MSVQDFLDFLKSSPTPYHAVEQVTKRLSQAGFEQIQESTDFSYQCQPGGMYYLVREASSIVAFTIGSSWTPGGPMGIIATHTDSPCLKLKPRSRDDGHHVLRASIEPYGNGIWETCTLHTVIAVNHFWHFVGFDRDLSIAGRVVLDSDTRPLAERLFSLDRPVCRIPTLAKYLTRSETWPAINKQTHLRPVFSIIDPTDSQLLSSTKPMSTTCQWPTLESERHHDELLDLIAGAASAPKTDILEIEAFLYDPQPPAIGGLRHDFVFGQRLDNLYMSFCAISALTQASSDPTSSPHTISMACLFDHEEIGSKSTQGAQSNLLPSIIRRLSKLRFGTRSMYSTSATACEQTQARSFLISADMAHGLHPNFAEKSDDLHAPFLNGGVAIKVNANMKYATSVPGLALMRKIASKHFVPLQLFTVRNDCPCGSTIGPILASLLGMRGVDVGVAQWSMHSIRETAGVKDIGHAIDLFRAFFVKVRGCLGCSGHGCSVISAKT